MIDSSNDLIEQLIERCEELAHGCEQRLGQSILQLIVRIRDDRRRRRVLNPGGRLELHLYPEREAGPREELFCRAAREHKHREGELKIDEFTTVSGDDAEGGEYVLAWVWVPNREVVFPKRFEADLYYRDEFHVLRHIDRHHVLAYDEPQAERMIFDRHWDCRLDSSGCAPYLDFHEVEMDAFHVFVEDPRDPLGVVTEHHLEAHCPEDVLECLKILYPVEEVESKIVDSAGNRWRLEDGEFVADVDDAGDSDVLRPSPDDIHVAFSQPQTIRGRTYAVEQVFLRLGGTPVPGENFAAKCDDAHWLSTREDVERWLVDRGLSTNEAQNLLLDAIERQERDRENP